MSIVDDQVRRLDAQLDKFQLAGGRSEQPASFEAEAAPVPSASDTARVQLKAVIRALSTTSSSRPVLSRLRLQNLVSQIQEHGHGLVKEADVSSGHTDLAWLATGKATVQLYGHILNSLLQQTTPLSESIWYWDDILGSYLNTGLYTLQTSPERFWKQAKEVYQDASARFRSENAVRQSATDARNSVMDGWREFYALVQNSVRERSLSQARSRILSPFALCRMQARKNQANIRRLREINASAIGLLVDEGLIFQPVDENDKAASPSVSISQWQSTIAKSVSLAESILRNATAEDTSIPDFEDGVFANVEGDPEFVSTNQDQETTANPSRLAGRIAQILREHLPEQEQSYLTTSSQYGRPSRLVRYWMPGVALLLSGSTLLRIFAHRRAEIIQWFQDFGVTVRDFYLNWVLEPSKKLIGTIRHDEQSEIAIMSKDSLKADRDSLERMVVDFAIEHPENGTKYTEPQIADLRAKVKEGDLTPVLKAYEREMQSPIKNVVMGDLVRTLLIQVQKTKVDVEVAIGGIDSLLKSQELLFGFVGIAPGLAISYFFTIWLKNALGSRRGLESGRKKGETVRLLRNIDRTLSLSTPTTNGMLSYKDHGLLLCEVQLLRKRAAAILPGNVQREFVEDINDLMDIRIGIEKQMKVVERIQWAYGRWLK